MISDKMYDEMNRQIAAEFHSAYIYLSLSGMFADMGLEGVAKWLRLQSEEEVTHAMKFFDYIISQDRRPVLREIPAIPETTGDIKAVFEDVLGQEKNVTKMIHSLVTLARLENDYESEIFLQWFVTEQIEEEDQVRDILDKIAIIGCCDGAGLLSLNSYMGSRVS